MCRRRRLTRALAALPPIVDPPYGFNPLTSIGIIPLITFGKPQAKNIYIGNPINALTIEDASIADPGSPIAIWAASDPTIIDAPTFSVGGVDPLTSYIGLSCFPGSPNTMSVVATFQTAGLPTITNARFARSSVKVWTQFDPSHPYLGTPTPGDGVTQGTLDSAPPIGSVSALTSLADTSSALINPEAYTLGGGNIVAPDQWHHLLVSFDISGPCVTFGPPQDFSGSSTFATTADGTTSYNRGWLAVDDVNYTGFDLSGNYIDGGADPNAILTAEAWNVANLVTSLPFNCTTAPASYSLEASPIPSLRRALSGFRPRPPSSTTSSRSRWPSSRCSLASAWTPG